MLCAFATADSCNSLHKEVRIYRLEPFGRAGAHSCAVTLLDVNTSAYFRGSAVVPHANAVTAGDGLGFLMACALI
jgi:hypothetical protein